MTKNNDAVLRKKTYLQQLQTKAIEKKYVKANFFNRIIKNHR